MTDRSVTHATFVLERTYDVPPARVFAAFADKSIKQRWFAAPEEMGPEQYELDFRIGGQESSRGGPEGGPTYAFEARYEDIVPNERIITSYQMSLNGERISVSVATIELKAQGAATRLILTEQGAYLDGLD
jgi:uncharacterized protein YndB with AHSA1/START domain